MTPRLSLGIVLGLAILALAPNVQAQQPGVRAESGGIAVGNVSGSTITIGIPPEQLEALVATRTKELTERTTEQKKLIALLEDKLSLNGQQIHAALDILGERDVPPERLAAKLIEVAERFKALQVTALAQPGDDAKIAALKAEAQKAIEAGDLAKADALLADVESEQRRMLDRLAVNAADTSARRGDIALTRLRYSEAAQHFANAAAALPVQTHGEFGGLGIEVTMEDGLVKVVAPIDDRPAAKAGIRANDVITHLDDEATQGMTLNQAVEKMRGPVNTKIRLRIMRKGADKPIEVAITRDIIRAESPYQNQRIDYLEREADALYQQGDELGDNAALLSAIERYKRLLALLPREQAPMRWANTQNSLGAALWSLGLRENGTARLEGAVAAFRLAQSERTRERSPREWSDTQNNIANVLAALGQLESGTTKLEEAVAAHHQALSERSREREPLDWATSQVNLGMALTMLGARENNIARLEEAVAAYRLGLDEFTRERTPLSWAAAQQALGGSLFAIGSSESSAARLKEAVAAYREALKEQTRERVPLKWAAVQTMLGDALTMLGERESETSRLDEAATAFREALKEFTRERTRRFWMAGQSSLAGVLVKLGAREGGTGRLEEAVIAYREELKELTREREPAVWAVTQNALGCVLAVLGTRENDHVRLEQAVAAYREALKEQTREREPTVWAATQNALGGVLAVLGTRENDHVRLEQAVAAYREALKERTRAGVPIDWGAFLKSLAEAQANLGYALYHRGDFAGAALNFRDVADGISAYPILWLYLADARSGGKNAKRDLQKSAASLKPAEWPFPVVELYLGRRTPVAMLAAARDPGERCEAHFYLGQWQLLRNKRADSIEALRNAVEACPKDFNEYAAAVAELKRLGR